MRLLLLFFSISNFSFQRFLNRVAKERFYFIPLFFNSSIFEIIFKIIKYKLSCFKQNMNWRYAIIFFFQYQISVSNNFCIALPRNEVILFHFFFILLSLNLFLWKISLGTVKIIRQRGKISQSIYDWQDHQFFFYDKLKNPLSINFSVLYISFIQAALNIN